ncbi:hypothetical protein PCANC_04114 [Puccinia coronata f. sp. avenae]|uniref:Uncharacterized protein n=1 Tax=Puccinia coronata f. sp. avenae TaxID=200324 RepID=A0A2N5W794_9BASI|nr:hypothetical protein PCANC_04114 [Puccinia coronata f. sp. avenae]
MANCTRLPVAGAGIFLKFQTNWAPAPTPAPAQAGTLVQVAGNRGYPPFHLLLGLVSSESSIPSLLRAPALVIKLGELTKLNDQHILLVIVQLTKLDDQCMVINLGDLTKLGTVRTCPTSQVPAGGYRVPANRYRFATSIKEPEWAQKEVEILTICNPRQKAT